MSPLSGIGGLLLPRALLELPGHLALTAEALGSMCTRLLSASAVGTGKDKRRIIAGAVFMTAGRGTQARASHPLAFTVGGRRWRDSLAVWVAQRADFDLTVLAPGAAVPVVFRHTAPLTAGQVHVAWTAELAGILTRVAVGLVSHTESVAICAPDPFPPGGTILAAVGPTTYVHIAAGTVIPLGQCRRNCARGRV